MNSVTIIGGGIAGIEAAIWYRKEGFEVELISERPYLFVYPLAIWIPVSKISFDKTTLSLHALARRHRFTLTLGRVTQISAKTRAITLENGETRSTDRLVIATGAGKTKHIGIEHTLSICGEPEQSLLLQQKIDELITRGSGSVAFGFGGNPKDTSAVRGGPGFELFFNLHYRLVQLGIRERFEMTFFAPMSEPGARMGKKALGMLGKIFEKNGFQTRYGKKIERFEAEGVVFEDGSRLQSDLTMFIPAGAGSELIVQSDLPKNEAGFIRINSFGEIEGVEGWYAIGDAAAIEGPEWRAKQGHVAEIMARNAAHNSALAAGVKSGIQQSYHDALAILCLMDMGNGAGLAYRDNAKTLFIPLPVIGHWLKIGWGWYYKYSKLGYIPRIPGM